MSSTLRPVITSLRLLGEPVEKRHANAMVKVLSDPEIYRFLADDPPSLEHLERQYEYLTGGMGPDGDYWLTWILMPKEESADPIGFIQATVKEPETAHIAYVLNPAHWLQGYGREAVTALLDVVFDRYEVERAIAEMDTRNEGSIGLVQSLGLRHVTTVRDADHFKGSTSDEHVYELTRSEWQDRSNRSGFGDQVLPGRG